MKAVIIYLLGLVVSFFIIWWLESCTALKPKDGCPSTNQKNLDKFNNRKFRAQIINTNRGTIPYLVLSVDSNHYKYLLKVRYLNEFSYVLYLCEPCPKPHTLVYLPRLKPYRVYSLTL